MRINGKLQEIFKQPKTDDGTKNSLRGLIKVVQADKTYIAVDRVSEEDEKTGCLETVFKDGVLLKDYSLKEIRERIDSTL